MRHSRFARQSVCELVGSASGLGGISMELIQCVVEPEMGFDRFIRSATALTIESLVLVMVPSESLVVINCL